ncbi:MAG: decarboxylating 6-phosphogluconate dehydrogenase [Phycisphaerae bacterium]|nr:decarboxylating 6-phosphogluconate dehydrogenase [Phycisphaerae bacterium]
MQIGFVGLGKMGGNMVLRLVIGSPDGKVKGGHQVVGFAKDPNPELVGIGGVSVLDTLDAMVAALAPPRVIWVMVPAGDPTESVITELATHLSPGDLIIDGGNSYFKDSVRRGKGLAARSIGFVDVGTSGGIWGRQEGYCMMVGGTPESIATIKPILDTLAPKDGWAHVGPSGAGHFVKMVHNGIEYGMMQAYGEGFEVLYKSQFPLDLRQIAAVWNRGSVVRSWLLELAEKSFETQPTLAGIEPYVEDSGEGRWTIAAAIEENVAVPVISASLFARFASRDPYNLSARFAAALRNQFGGHNIKKATEKQITQEGQVK